MADRVGSSGAKWVVVTGAPRSGTTMLQQILNTHPQVSCMHEINILKYLKVLTGLFYAEDSQKVHNALARSLGDRDTIEIDGETRSRSIKAFEFIDERSGRVGSVVDPMMVPKRANLLEIAMSAFKAISKKENIKVYADKMPNWQKFEDFECEIEFKLKLSYIFIVRNPIHVINSSIARRNRAAEGSDTWPINSVEEAASEWLEAWRYMVVASAAERPSLMLKYEDIVDGDGVQLSRISGFLDVPNHFKDISERRPSSLDFYAISQAEFDSAKCIFGELIDKWVDLSIPQMIEKYGLLLKTLNSNEIYSIYSLGDKDIYLRGFDVKINEGRWSLHRRVQCIFMLAEELVGSEICIELNIFPWFGTQDRFELFTKSDESSLITHTISKKDMDGPAKIYHFTRVSSTKVEVQFIIPNVKAVEEDHNDLRMLGILLNSFMFSCI